MHADAESYFVPQNFSPSIWNMTECLKWEPILFYPSLPIKLDYCLVQGGR